MAGLGQQWAVMGDADVESWSISGRGGEGTVLREQTVGMFQGKTAIRSP